MSVSAPVRCEPARPARFQVAVIPFPASPAAPAQHVLSVEFGSPDGRSWQAIGGGDTLADAIAFAQESCPNDASWQPIRWNDLCGD